MSKLYTKSSGINNTGLYTKVDLHAGQHIAFITGPVHVFRTFTDEVSQKMLNWIGVGKYSWINTDKSIFRFINHSCDPNVAQITKRKVIAIKDIKQDTELTMDYSFTEAEPGWKIENCNCGTKQCRRTIKPIMNLPQAVFKKQQAYIPKNFRLIYDAYHSRKTVQR